MLLRQNDVYMRTVTSDDWSKTLAPFADATVFHTLPWLDAVAATFGLEVLLLACWCGTQCVAVWPALVMRKGLLRIVGSPLPGWSTAYLGPLIAPGADVRATLRAFLDHPKLQRHSYFACKVIDPCQQIDLSAFGFTQALRYDTYRLDLAPPEEALWNNVRSECRKHIRKATRCGVEVRAESSPDFLDEYWDMTVETFGKSGLRPTHNRRLLDEIWNRLHHTGHLHALSAIYEGQRIASLIVLRDERVMYNWGSASRQAMRHLPAPSLLQWEAVRLAKRLEIPTYDFISTTGGPGKFKQSFGPQQVAIATHWERSPSRLMKAIKDRYVHFLRWRSQRRTVENAAN